MLLVFGSLKGCYTYPLVKSFTTCTLRRCDSFGGDENIFPSVMLPNQFLPHFMDDEGMKHVKRMILYLANIDIIYPKIDANPLVWIPVKQWGLTLAYTGVCTCTGQRHETVWHYPGVNSFCARHKWTEIYVTKIIWNMYNFYYTHLYYKTFRHMGSSCGVGSACFRHLTVYRRAFWPPDHHHHDGQKFQKYFLVFEF